MRKYFAIVALIVALPAAAVGAPPSETGRHDFDYQFGVWNVRVSRLLHPGSPNSRWVSYRGTHTVTPLWNGRSNIGVLEIAGTSGSIEGLQLRLFDPATHLWRLSFASSSDGVLNPPQIGRFHDGVGEFVDRETIAGRPAIVRSISRSLSATSYRDEIARSFDGGRTWQLYWIALYQKSGAGR